MSTQKSNNSNGKYVTVEQLAEENIWVACYSHQADGSTIAINADGKEPTPEGGLDEFLESSSADPSKLDEIRDYRESNDNLVESIGILTTEVELVIGDDAEEAVQRYNELVHEKEQEQAEYEKEVKSDDDLSKAQIKCILHNKLEEEYATSDGSYYELAKEYESLRDALSKSERNRIQYETQIDDDIYKGLPSELDVLRMEDKYVRITGDEPSQLTNFVLNVQSFLNSDDDIKVELEVVPSSPFEDPYETIVSIDIFNDVSEFKEKVCTGKTTTYSGSSRELNGIKTLVGHQKAPDRIGTNTVGLHDGEMVTPAGVIDDEWKVENPQHRFEPKQQAVESKWDLDVGDESEYDEKEVGNIVRTLWQTRDSERFLPILGYWYSSLLSTKIRGLEGELPLATVMADTGAGKSSTLGLMYELIGMDGNPYSARDTKYALLNALSSTNNIPIWLDEYKPSDMQSYEIDALQDFLRKSTRRGDETRGNADQTVTTYTIESPVVLSGEESIQGSAEERRSIRTQFRTAVTDADSEYAKYWAELNGGSYKNNSETVYCDGFNLSEHAKAVWQFVLSIDDFESRWKKATKTVYKTLEEAGIVGISDLEITALTMIQFGCEMYREMGIEHGVDENDIPTDDDVDEALLYIAKKMGEANRTSHIDEFFSLLGDVIESNELTKEGEIESHEGSWTLVHKGEKNEQLRFKLETAHHAVSKYIRDHDLNGIDLLDKASDYRKRMKDDVGYVTETSIPTAGLGRCVSIDTHEAEAVIDGFERGQVNPDAYYTEQN